MQGRPPESLVLTWGSTRSLECSLNRHIFCSSWAQKHQIVPVECDRWKPEEKPVMVWLANQHGREMMKISLAWQENGRNDCWRRHGHQDSKSSQRSTHWTPMFASFPVRISCDTVLEHAKFDSGGLTIKKMTLCPFRPDPKSSSCLLLPGHLLQFKR